MVCWTWQKEKTVGWAGIDHEITCASLHPHDGSQAISSGPSHIRTWTFAANGTKPPSEFLKRKLSNYVSHAWLKSGSMVTCQQDGTFLVTEPTLKFRDKGGFPADMLSDIHVEGMVPYGEGFILFGKKGFVAIFEGEPRQKAGEPKGKKGSRPDGGKHNEPLGPRARKAAEAAARAKAAAEAASSAGSRGSGRAVMPKKRDLPIWDLKAQEEKAGGKQDPASSASNSASAASAAAAAAAAASQGGGADPFAKHRWRLFNAGNLEVIQAVAVAPGGEKEAVLLFRSHQVMTFPLKDRECILRGTNPFSYLMCPVHDGAVSAVDVARDKPLAATVGADLTVRLWNTLSFTCEVSVCRLFR
jgi:WD40 repeat protein